MAIVLLISFAYGASAQTIPAAETPATATQATPVDQVAPAAPSDQLAPAPANPNPAPPPVTSPAQPVVAQAPRPAPRPRPTPFRAWYPVIDFVATFTQPAYYLNSSQLINYDPLDLGGTVRIPVTPKINLYFDRITEGTIEQPLERAINPANGTPILAAHSRDILLQYHATYTFNRFLTMDVGDGFRHRVYAYRDVVVGGTVNAPITVPAFNLTTISSQPYPFTLNSQEAHYGYLGFTYTTKPWKEAWGSVFAFTATGQTQNVDHSVAMMCTAGNKAAFPTNTCGTNPATLVGLFDIRPGVQRYYTDTLAATWILPLDVKRGVTFTTNYRNGFLNWYENAPFPYHWNVAWVWQLNKRFSPGFTLAMRHQDLHQAAQGHPFPTPNAVHVGSWDVIGTFHVDTKTFFGL